MAAVAVRYASPQKHPTAWDCGAFKSAPDVKRKPRLAGGGFSACLIARKRYAAAIAFSISCTP
jgi:hypothetical protein